jgi:hypothetical protein
MEERLAFDIIHGRQILRSGDGLRQTDEDIRYIRERLDEFLGYVRTPARVLSWCFTAMAAGILGEIGFKMFKWIAHFGAKVGN